MNDGYTYSLESIDSVDNPNQVRELTPKRKKRFSPRLVMRRIVQSSEESDLCGNAYDDSEEIRTRGSEYKTVPDNPEVDLGKAVIKVSLYIDEMLFRHRFASNMTEAINFAGIHSGYLQKQLQQGNLLKNIQIDIVVVHFGIAPFYDTHQWPIKKYLDMFCWWARKNSSAHFADTNILLTGTVLWRVEPGTSKASASIKGLAYVGTTCMISSCMIVEARIGYKSTLVLVHEFGHNLGADHDGEVKYQTERCHNDAFIMSWAVSVEKVTWSECSVKHIRQFMLSKERDPESLRVKCLSEDAEPVDPSLDTKKENLQFPGQYIDIDEQCRMVFGPKFSFLNEDMNNVCLNMKCKNNFFVVKGNFGALEGTSCGLNRRCEHSKCKRIPLEDFDGYVDEQKFSKTYFEDVYSNITFI